MSIDFQIYTREELSIFFKPQSISNLVNSQYYYSDKYTLYKIGAQVLDTAKYIGWFGLSIGLIDSINRFIYLFD